MLKEKFSYIFYAAQLKLQINQNKLLSEYPEDSELPEADAKSHYNASKDVTIVDVRHTERDPLIESQICYGTEHPNMVEGEI